MRLTMNFASDVAVTTTFLCSLWQSQKQNNACHTFRREKEREGKRERKTGDGRALSG